MHNTSQKPSKISFKQSWSYIIAKASLQLCIWFNYRLMKDHRHHFKPAKRGGKQRTIPSCIKLSLSELKKASIRLQNNKFPLKKRKAWGSYACWQWRSEFSVRNKLPKNLTVKAKKSCKLRTQAMIHHLAVFKNWSMRWSSFKEIKCSKLNH